MVAMSRGCRISVLCAVALAVAWGCAASRPNGGQGSVGALRACPSSPNCAATEPSGELPPFRLALPAAAAWPRVREAIASLERCRVAEESPTYLRAECTSRVFRFVDDLEIEQRTESATLAVRSASRSGYSDLGVNRRRVERLRALLIERGVVRK